MINTEITLARAFGWSLYDIDRTDASSLIPFILQMGDEADEKPVVSPGKKNNKNPTRTKRVYCDQVNL